MVSVELLYPEVLSVELLYPELLSVEELPQPLLLLDSEVVGPTHDVVVSEELGDQVLVVG